MIDAYEHFLLDIFIEKNLKYFPKKTTCNKIHIYFLSTHISQLKCPLNSHLICTEKVPIRNYMVLFYTLVLMLLIINSSQIASSIPQQKIGNETKSEKKKIY